MRTSIPEKRPDIPDPEALFQRFPTILDRSRGAIIRVSGGELCLGRRSCESYFTHNCLQSMQRLWALTQGNRTRIALLDDHTLFREILAQSLAAEPDFELVCQCGTVQEMLEFIGHSPVDLILLDINLGAEQGGSFLTRARGAGFNGKVLVLTAGVGNREAAWLIDRGCSGIVFKNEASSALLERIRQVIAGTEPKPQFERGPEAHEPSRALTGREREVLRAVCQGLANKEIAHRLSISENSVKSFLQQLFQKTGVRTRAQLVAAAIEIYWDQLQ